MARPIGQIPTYRKHAKSGQAVVTVRRPDGTRRDLYLGAFGSEVSRLEYERVLAILRTNRGFYVESVAQTGLVTLGELIAKFVNEHVDIHYRHQDGTYTSERNDYLISLRPLVRLFASKLASEFTVLDLRVYREAVVSGSWRTPEENEALRRDCGKDGTVSRKTTNQRVGRIKRLFRWAVSFGMVPPTVAHGLDCLQGLQPGRSDARETEAVEAVAIEDYEATLPHLPEVVADLLRVQLACGARCGEIVGMRTADIDLNGPGGTWVYRPSSHKNRWRGHDRRIVLGPRAQLVLRRYLRNEAPEAFVFQPVAGKNARKTNLPANRAYTV